MDSGIAQREACRPIHSSPRALAPRSYLPFAVPLPACAVPPPAAAVDPVPEVPTKVPPPAPVPAVVDPRLPSSKDGLDACCDCVPTSVGAGVTCAGSVASGGIVTGGGVAAVVAAVEASSEPVKVDGASVAGGRVTCCEPNRPGEKVPCWTGVYKDDPSELPPPPPSGEAVDWPLAWAADAEQMHTVLHAPEFM